MALTDKLNAIGREVMTLSGSSDKVTLDQMASYTKEANNEVDTQENIIQQITEALRGKVIPGTGGETMPTQEKTIDIKDNGIVEVIPDEGHLLSKVIANIHVPIPEGYIVPSGTLNLDKNGIYDVTEKAEVQVAVPEREIILQDKEITENGVYVADDGFDGFGQITINIEGGEVKPDPSAEYQRVESITNDSNSYFLTDVIADNYTGAELTASYPSQEDRVSMGSTTSTSNTRFYVPYLLSASSIYYGYNAGTSVTFSSSKNTKYTASLNFLNNRAAALYDANGLAQAGQIMTRSVTQQNAPIAIGCYKNPTGKGAIRLMTIYRVRLSQGAEIIRDYVPCYRKSDGEVGLYDRITGQFLTNAGEGSFTIGEEIDWNLDTAASAFALNRQYPEDEVAVEDIEIFDDENN